MTIHTSKSPDLFLKVGRIGNGHLDPICGESFKETEFWKHTIKICDTRIDAVRCRQEAPERRPAEDRALPLRLAGGIAALPWDSDSGEGLPWVAGGVARHLCRRLRQSALRAD